jgi:hypothetical protein
MKGLLIGSDFVKDSNGDLKLLEINTNALVEVKELSNMDFNSFFNFMSNNSLNELHLISNKDGLNSILETECQNRGVSFVLHQTAKDSIVVPSVEDLPNRFILRVSYDSTSIVDDEYANNNRNTLDLVRGTSLESPQYFDADFDTLTSTFTPSVNNEPNYIVKSISPNYNKDVLPQLYKIDTIEELETLKNSLLENEYISKYYMNTTPTQKWGDRHFVFRSVDIIAGSSLEYHIHLGSYKRLAQSSKGFFGTNQYDNNKKLWAGQRVEYITNYTLQGRESLILTNEDRLLDTNNNWVPVSNLLIGDSLNSAFLDGLPEDQEYAFQNWSGTWESVNTSFQIQPTQIQSVRNVVEEDFYFKIKLENGIEWVDVQDSYFLVEDTENIVRFKRAKTLNVLDKFIIWNKVTEVLDKLSITNIWVGFGEKTGVLLDVEPKDLFIVDLNESLGVIQHNVGLCSCLVNVSGRLCPGCPGYLWGYTCSAKCDSGCSYLCTGNCYGCQDCDFCKGGTTPCACSDVNLKKNIKFIGTSPSGIKIYQFEYKNPVKHGKGVYMGTIAQELFNTKWENAVNKNKNGELCIDYSQIDVRFIKIK